MLQLVKQSVSYNYNNCKRKSIKLQLQLHKAELDSLIQVLPELVHLFLPQQND